MPTRRILICFSPLGPRETTLRDGIPVSAASTNSEDIDQSCEMALHRPSRGEGGEANRTSRFTFGRRTAANLQRSVSGETTDVFVNNRVMHRVGTIGACPGPLKVPLSLASYPMLFAEDR